MRLIRECNLYASIYGACFSMHKTSISLHLVKVEHIIKLCCNLNDLIVYVSSSWTVYHTNLLRTCTVHYVYVKHWPIRNRYHYSIQFTLLFRLFSVKQILMRFLSGQWPQQNQTSFHSHLLQINDPIRWWRHLPYHTIKGHSS